MKFLIFCVALAATLSACAGPETRIAKISDEIIRENYYENGKEKIASLAGMVKQPDLAGKRLETYSDRTLIRLYEALSDYTFYFPDDAARVEMQASVLAEKARRGKCVNTDFVKMCMRYLAARRLDKAAVFQKQYPDAKLPFIPIMVSPDGVIPQSTRWQVYDISDGGRSAQLKVLPLESGPRIAMVMLTGCAKAEEAMSDMLADAEIGPVFRKYGAVITAKFDSQGVYMWRDYFRFPDVYITGGNDSFPGFDLARSPCIHFMKDGKILVRQLGWGSDRQKAEALSEFRSNMKTIGL